MSVPHTKMKQAIKMHCHLSTNSDGLFRIYWPDKSIELLYNSADAALEEMAAVQAIIRDFPVRVLGGSGSLVSVYNDNGKVMAGCPTFPSQILSQLEANEDRWASDSAADLAERMLKAGYSDDKHINGIPKDGGIAYREGVPSSDCPYLEEDDDFERWNDEWDRAADQAIAAESKPHVGSVITSRYRAHYSELGHPTHCGDELAILLNNICSNKAGTNLELFEAICAANGVSLAKYNRTSKGWQGRLRMTGRNLLSKKLVENGGLLKMPEGFGTEHYQLDQRWVTQTAVKFKPKEHNNER